MTNNGARRLRTELRACARTGLEGALAARLNRREAARLSADWTQIARDDQLPPGLFSPGEGDDWRVWLFLAGRGAGKTRAGAEWVRALALGLAPIADHSHRRIALIAPTYHEARAVMVEGVSGLLAVHGHGPRPRFHASRRLIEWPNGAVAQLFSADEPEALRGPQFDAAWCDELARWRHGQEAWDMLQFALRLGRRPRVCITTTPRPTGLMRALVNDPDVALTRATTHDNAANLATTFIADVTRRYGGTRLGRQELDGELIDDDPDALFQRDLIEAGRRRQPGELARIVVAVDPPAGSGARANGCGIVCAGIDRMGHGYVLEDASLARASPNRWAGAAIALYHRWGADRLIAEVNQGGDMVAAIIAGIDATVHVSPVHAGRGKRLRAEPVAALYEQGRVSHVGAWPQLEDEMCAFDQLAACGHASPDRVDALVWALSELMLKPPRATPRIRTI